MLTAILEILQKQNLFVNDEQNTGHADVPSDMANHLKHMPTAGGSMDAAGKGS